MTAKGDIVAQNGQGQWLRFRNPKRVHVATEVCAVADVLSDVDAAIAGGIPVAGFVAYEAAGGIDPYLITHSTDACPLVWFGEYSEPDILEHLPEPQQPPPTLSWHPSITDADYVAAISRIKQYILSGDTYQVNFTIRMQCRSVGDPYSLFYRLQASQQAENAVYLDLGDMAICSASPELFFTVDGKQILMRPMKGTARRGTTADDDRQHVQALFKSQKNRAENVMIVDMIRNDIGRVADPGTVRVTRLFDVERYPTVNQMTSTVVGMTSASLSELMHALFPCASITGAPKVRTMQIIKEIETEPRGIYTGTLGYWLPGRKARFNVAIRTVAVDKVTDDATYGVGGGIVWDSVDHHELAECLTKADVLNAPWRPFSILETLLWTSLDGFYLLDRHIDRAKQSADYFEYCFDEVAMQKQLADAVKECGAGAWRVRWLLARDGEAMTEFSALDLDRQRPLRVGVVVDACVSTNVFLYHKTTNRTVYGDALEQCPDCDDILLINERGEVTESTIANVVIEIEGERITPPVSSGLLAGTFRGELIEQGEIREGIVTSQMLAKADFVFLINSVRKWIPVTIIGLQ